jgi:hypothetical protein
VGKGGTNWLLRADAGGIHGLRGHHLDGLGLLDFLGRHCEFVRVCLTKGSYV